LLEKDVAGGRAALWENTAYVNNPEQQATMTGNKKSAKQRSDNQKARARYQTKGFPASWHCTFSPLKANTNITPQPMANRMYQSQRSAGNCLRNATNSHV